MSLTPAELRIRDVPWDDLAPLRAPLAPALDEVLAGTPAERVLDRFLRAHRHLDATQRRLAAEALFGVGLWRRRLGHHFPPDQRTGRALLDALVLDLGGRGDLPPPADWRDRFSVPDWLADLFERDVGDEAPQLAAAFNLPGPVCLRVNRRRTSPPALAAALRALGVDSAPGRYAPDALVLTTPRPNIYALAAALPGHFEVQDEGSQLLGHLLDAGEGDHVLDLCAGAGGKALQLASLVGPSGRIHATDVDLARLERLRTRASKAGVTITIHGASAPASLQVPRVLVDAPCSELGTLRRGPDLRWRLDPLDFAPLPALQEALVHQGLAHLAPGGRLVYATCTLRAEENQAVVDAVLATAPELTLTRPALPDALPDALLDARGCLRLLPHRHGTDGFFAAVFVRR